MLGAGWWVCWVNRFLVMLATVGVGLLACFCGLLRVASGFEGWVSIIEGSVGPFVCWGLGLSSVGLMLRRVN